MAYHGMFYIDYKLIPESAMKMKAIFWSNNHDLNISDYISHSMENRVLIKQTRSKEELINYLQHDNSISMVLTVVNVSDITSLYQVQQVQQQFADMPMMAVFDNGSRFTLLNSVEKLFGMLNNHPLMQKPASSHSFMEQNKDTRFKNDVKLTRRQLDVLKLIVCGKSNKQIARDLNLSEGTVKTHCMAIFKGIGVTNRTQAALRAEALMHGGNLAFNG